jgi:hypothetical protein
LGSLDPISFSISFLVRLILNHNQGRFHHTVSASGSENIASIATHPEKAAGRNDHPAIVSFAHRGSAGSNSRAASSIGGGAELVLFTRIAVRALRTISDHFCRLAMARFLCFTIDSGFNFGGIDIV